MEDTTPTAGPGGHPLLVGYRAVRANLLPGLALQLLMLATVFAYYRAGWARPAFDHLGELKARGGVIFTFVSSVIAGAIFPETFKWFVVRPRPSARKAGADFAFAAAFYGFGAIVVDLMYRAQAVWFGTEPTVGTLLKKVAFDQCVLPRRFGRAVRGGVFRVGRTPGIAGPTALPGQRPECTRAGVCRRCSPIGRCGSRWWRCSTACRRCCRSRSTVSCYASGH